MNQPIDHPTKNPVERRKRRRGEKTSTKLAVSLSRCLLPHDSPTPSKQTKPKTAASKHTFLVYPFMMYTHTSFFHRFSSSLLFTSVNQNALLTGFVLMFPSLYTFLRLLCCAFPLIRDVGSGYRTLTRFYRPRSSENMDGGRASGKRGRRPLDRKAGVE
ncbi:hypothetical protein QBC32DRAFT_1630 [Pseudoneurospora amorphoporcata]|uniref:Transmembrane protein n=1 Tax=Pseudoneurospora amorphoporcata TaxID=241081 RepID=A0AAN6P3J0_9PEZI|nr:hypothetical protein QBC32DRAFT_1630 [Pseudoneurospora amorphoporcata]